MEKNGFKTKFDGFPIQLAARLFKDLGSAGVSLRVLLGEDQIRKGIISRRYFYFQSKIENATFSLDPFVLLCLARSKHR